MNYNRLNLSPSVGKLTHRYDASPTPTAYALYVLTSPPDLNPVGLINRILKVVKLPQGNEDKGILTPHINNLQCYLACIIGK